MLGNLVFLGVHGAFATASSAFLQWGRRIPFLLSAVLLAGALSDTYGRRRVLAFGSALALPWTLVLFPLIQSGDPVRYAVAVIGTYVVVGIMMGPLAAFIQEIFAARHCYTSTGLSYNAGGILGGALPPVLSPVLLSSYGSSSVTAMMAGVTMTSLVSVLLTETAGRSLDFSETLAAGHSRLSRHIDRQRAA